MPLPAVPAMNWALSSGIVQGNGGLPLSNASCTRGQIVTFLYCRRFFRKGKMFPALGKYIGGIYTARQGEWQRGILFPFCVDKTRRGQGSGMTFHVEKSTFYAKRLKSWGNMV